MKSVSQRDSPNCSQLLIFCYDLRMKTKTLFLAVLLLGASFVRAQNEPVVAVTGGKIRGSLTGDGGAAFKAIPYARPPVGDLRWREPQPVEPWDAVRDALRFSIACTQLSEGWNDRFVSTSGEDCLYLNVAAPQWPPKTKHPVMFWIHGGSNMAGDADDAAFDQRTLVRPGIVLVTVSYRLGALGFLVHPELDNESPHPTSGDYGLMDQIAALRWVQDNIDKFGGDPNNVTIFGESAGALDIGLLMTSPLAKGLFHRAILGSGTPLSFSGPRQKRFAVELTHKLAARLNAPNQGTIKFLRTVPAKTILTEMQAATADDRSGLLASFDGWVLFENPATVFAEGGSLPVPMLIGSNAQEIPGPEVPAEVRESIRKAYGPLAEHGLELYGLAGEGVGKTEPINGGSAIQWATDDGFRCPAILQAADHASAGHPAFLYEFEHPRPGDKSMCHACELNFLFTAWGKDVQLTPIDRKLSDQMQAYWINFARNGDPNGAGLPAWPSFTKDTQGYLAFTDEGAVAKAGLRRNYCALWSQAYRARQAKDAAGNSH